ncbi:MAG: GyrI-like domain-containing protein [Chloroflexi bacterium]|nr:GyrI-like domain-containing protein [Chloroflexota bacterium]
MNNNLTVRLVELPPMRVASVLGFGAEPEALAWRKLMAWAEPRGLLRVQPEPRIFGFNNPSPTPGSPNYGYEFWITIDPEVESDDSVTVKDFSGGLYAVTRCKGVETIYNTWQQLVAWLETSPYKPAKHQWLEEHINVGADVPPEELVLDLYLPVKA